MTIDIQNFTDDQKNFLSHIVSDLDGPTSTGTLLLIMETLLDELRPCWDLSTLSDDPQLSSDMAVCLAALQYLKVKYVAEA